MKIRRIEIENFRGIKELDFRVPEAQKFVCLVGSGDSSKTTIIEAIHLAIGERWALSLDDTDFYGGVVADPIAIRVALTDLTPEVLGHQMLSMQLSGIHPDGTWEHDPVIGTEACLIVELSVDQDLDPTWHIYRPGGSVGPNLSAGTRRLFSVFRIDERVNHHLRWAKTSALTRLTDDSHGTAGTLASAVVAARAAVDGAISASLQSLTNDIAARLSDLGSGSFPNLHPGLDTSTAGSSGTLALFEDSIPLTSFGLGTRRLAGIATQELASAGKSIMLIDEVEHGLEPHRLVYLLKRLRDPAYPSQVFVTTHSPVAVEQLDSADIAIVRSVGGSVTCQLVPDDMDFAQSTLRGGPSAFLARHVVVTEGGTEFGLLLELVESWDRAAAISGSPTSAAIGVAIADGGGSKAPKRAEVLCELGYEVAMLLDSDDSTIDAAVAQAVSVGVVSFRWRAGFAIEDELMQEFDAPLLSALVQVAVETRSSSHTVLDDIVAHVGSYPAPTDLDIDRWITEAGISIDDARQVLALAARKRKWFKAIPAGRRLGLFVIANGPAIAATTFGLNLLALKAGIYPPDAPIASAGAAAPASP